jgi:hypothetical protein
VIELWRDHSLTITCWVIGVLFMVLAWMFDEGKMFDTLLTIGGGVLTVALFYTLAGPLHERNKPEEE